MIKIEKGIPIPELKEKYPWGEMKVGDAIFTTRKVTATYHSWSKINHNGKRKFITRSGSKYYDTRTNMELSAIVAEKMQAGPLKKFLKEEKGFYTWRVE